MKRIGNSFKGILGGFIAIAIGVILLWWNEGNNVKNIKTTNEMGKSYIDVSSEKVDSNNEGKLIATHGKLINEEELYDSVFDVRVNTPVLERKVEMYQWEEKSDTDDDGETKYTYNKVWKEGLIDSNNFHTNGYTNPSTMPYNSIKYISQYVTVGAFVLTKDQLNTLNTDGIFSEFNTEKISELNYTINGNYIVNSTDINNPQIGDLRISFVYNNSTDVSVLAVQSGNSFKDYESTSGKKVNRVMDGIHSGEEMISVIEKENKAIKWVLRIAGTLIIVIGFATILKPITAITSYVPILGSIVGSAVGLVSFLLGFAVSLVVIAIAWIRFRPLLGIILLAGAAALIVLLIKRGKRKKQAFTESMNQNNNNVQ